MTPAATPANPGQDSIAKWKAALAASRRQQRRRRGKRTQDASSFPVAGPGMVRIVPRPPRDS
jgi:hypothetical protein